MKAKKKADWSMRFITLFVIFMTTALFLPLVAAAIKIEMPLISIVACMFLGVISFSLAMRIRYREIMGK